MDDIDLKLDKFFTSYSIDMKILIEKMTTRNFLSDERFDNSLCKDYCYDDHLLNSSGSGKQAKSILHKPSIIKNDSGSMLGSFSGGNGKKLVHKNVSYSSINEERIFELTKEEKYDRMEKLKEEKKPNSKAISYDYKVEDNLSSSYEDEDEYYEDVDYEYDQNEDDIANNQNNLVKFKLPSVFRPYNNNSSEKSNESRRLLGSKKKPFSKYFSPSKRKKDDRSLMRKYFVKKLGLKSKQKQNSISSCNNNASPSRKNVINEKLSKNKLQKFKSDSELINDRNYLLFNLFEANQCNIVNKTSAENPMDTRLLLNRSNLVDSNSKSDSVNINKLDVTFKLADTNTQKMDLRENKSSSATVKTSSQSPMLFEKESKEAKPNSLDGSKVSLLINKENNNRDENVAYCLIQMDEFHRSNNENDKADLLNSNDEASNNKK